MRLLPVRRSSLGGASSLLGLCLLSQGCAVSEGELDEADAESETGGDTGDTGETGESFEPIPARGDIALTQVVVNQGVDVPIANAGEWIGPSERNTYLVAERDTLLRGSWEIPEDWTPRKITAVLELGFPDGSSETLEDTVMIEGPSFSGDLNRTFTFALLAEQFLPGLKYHLSLWEAEPGAELERESQSVIESPLGGPELVGVQPEPAELEVVMMPVAYNAPGCTTNTATGVSEEQEQLFIDYLHEQYPVQEVVWDFRRDTPIEWNEELTSLAQLWAPLQDQRAADEAAPNVYYYALVDACASGINGAGGIAPGLATDTKAAAFERVSSGLWLPDNESYSYHTMVHELGHNHGRAHVFCAGGDAAGTDPSYPHNDGATGVWGFGIRLFKLHSPTSSWDFMTYCSPNWVSDWGWSKAYERVRTLSAWNYEASGDGDGDVGEVLVGLLFEDGSEQWWTTPGAREPEFFASGEQVSFEYGDLVLDSPAQVQLLDDGTQMVTARVPRPQVPFEAATRIDASEAARPIHLETPQTRAWSR